MNPYHILGVEVSATLPEIKAAYRKLSKTHHPDMTKSACSEAFRNIQRSYEVLSDPEKREAYDRTGKMPDEKPDETIQKVIQLFELVVDKQIKAGKSLRSLDILRTMHAVLDESISLLREDMRQITMKIRALEKGLRKIKSPQGRENIFDGILTARIEKARAQSVARNEQIALHQKIKLFLDDFEEEASEPTKYNGPKSSDENLEKLFKAVFGAERRY